MKNITINTKVIFIGIALFILLIIFASKPTHAADISWDGGGGDNALNNPTNWVGDVVPTAGDNAIIYTDNFASDTVLTNSGTFQAYAIVFDTLDISNEHEMTITGDAIQLTGNLTNGLSVPINIDTDIWIDNSMVTFYGRINLINSNPQAKPHQVGLGSLGATQILRLNVVNGTSYVIFDHEIIGDGSIIVESGSSAIFKRPSTFTGSVVNHGYIEAKSANSLGDNNNAVNVSGNGTINYCLPNYSFVGHTFFLNSSNLTQGAISSTDYCGWFAPPARSGKNITFTGAVYLMQDTVVWSDDDMIFAGAVVEDTGATGSALRIIDGVPGTLIISASTNTIDTPNGTYKSALKTVTVNDTAKTNLAIIHNQLVIVNSGAEAGEVYMYGGTLKGVGTVGRINMSGGLLAPGLSPGILNSGDYLVDGGTFEAELGGTTAGEYDQLNVTGTVNLGSATALSVVHWNNFRPALNNQFVIINNDGADAVTGTFQGLAQGATVTVDGVTYTISYTGGDGNDVVLTATGGSVSDGASTVGTPNTGLMGLGSSTILTLFSILVIASGAYIVKTKKI